MQIEIITLAISIVFSAILAVWQLRASSKDIAEAVERAITAIHSDIKASQEKLEKKATKGKQLNIKNLH